MEIDHRGTIFRWTEGAARAYLPVADQRPAGLRAVVRPHPRLAGRTLVVRLNGVAIYESPLGDGWQEVVGEWPRQSLKIGGNVVEWSLGASVRPADFGEPDGRALGMAIQAIRLLPE